MSGGELGGPKGFNGVSEKRGMRENIKVASLREIGDNLGAWLTAVSMTGGVSLGVRCRD